MKLGLGSLRLWLVVALIERPTSSEYSRSVTWAFHILARRNNVVSVRVIRDKESHFMYTRTQYLSLYMPNNLTTAYLTKEYLRHFS